MQKAGRETHLNALEGRQERERTDLSKDCSRTSLIGIKDSKNYSK